MKNKPHTINIVIAISLLGIIYYIGALLTGLMKNFIGDAFLWFELIRIVPSIFSAILIAVAFQLKMPWSIKAFNLVTLILTIATLILAYLQIVSPEVDLDNNQDQQLGYSLATVISNAIYLGGLFITNRFVNRGKVVSYFMYDDDPITELENVFE